MKRKFILIFIFFPLSITYAQFSDSRINQEILRDIPVSTKVAEMLRFDQMPPSSYTGVPSISVPIYNIKSGDLSLPLTLNYHAGGIQVNQLSGEFGLGWSMNLPSITQVVNDKDDLDRLFNSDKPDFIPGNSPMMEGVSVFDRTEINMGDRVPKVTYIKNYHPFNSFSSETYKGVYYACFITGWLPLNGQYHGRTDKTWQYQEHYYDVDGEYDVFRVNMPDETFSFIVRRLHNEDKIFQIITLNSKIYKVDYEYDGPYEANDYKDGNLKKLKWIVTSNKGVIYRFEKCEITKSTSNTQNRVIKSGNYSKFADSFNNKPMSSFRTGGTISGRRWPISIIKDQKRSFIAFKYNEYNNVPSLPTCNEHLESLKFDKDKDGRYKQYRFYSSGPLKLIRPTSGYYTDEKIIKRSSSYIGSNKLLLSSINFRVGYVNFSKNKGPFNQYSNIQITDYNTHKIEDIKLSYATTISDDPTQSKATYYGIDCRKRAFLKSVSSKNNGVYQFEYNKTKLPNLLSLATDYWGYYNGALKNKSKIPKLEQYKDEFPVMNNNKKANIEYCQAGTLTKITYPTGGCLTYKFELNEFDKQIDGTTKGAGIRVKSINSYSEGKQISSRQFVYEGGLLKYPLIFENSGLKANILIKNQPDWLEHVEYYSYFTKKLYGGNFVHPVTYYNASSLGYDKVTEKQFEGDNKYIGKVERYYKNDPLINTYSKVRANPICPAPIFLETSKSIESGFNYKEITYGADDKKRQMKEWTRLKTTLLNSGHLYNIKWGERSLLFNQTKCNPETASCPSSGRRTREFNTNVVMYYMVPLPRVYSSKHGTITNYDKNGHSLRTPAGVTEQRTQYAGQSYYLIENKSFPYRKNYYNTKTIHYTYPISKKDRISKEMMKRNMVNFPLEEITKQGYRPIELKEVLYSTHEERHIEYDKFHNLILPSKVFKKDFCKDRLIIELTKYDEWGNIIEYKDSRGCITSLIWGYYERYKASLSVSKN